MAARRSRLWRYRRLLFLFGLLGFSAIAGAAYLATRLPLPSERRQVQASFLTDATGAPPAPLQSGVEAAAQAYFGEHVGQLGLKEAAYLAGLIRAPQLADVARDPVNAEARRASSLRAMLRAHRISPRQRDDVTAIPLASYVVAGRT